MAMSERTKQNIGSGILLLAFICVIVAAVIVPGDFEPKFWIVLIVATWCGAGAVHIRSYNNVKGILGGVVGGALGVGLYGFLETLFGPGRHKWGGLVGALMMFGCGVLSGGFYGSIGGLFYALVAGFVEESLRSMHQKNELSESVGRGTQLNEVSRKPAGERAEQ
jgi:hypothetical protein